MHVKDTFIFFLTDINECKENFPCSHMCNNTIGSFYCSCAEGYILESDKRYCKVAQGKYFKLQYFVPPYIHTLLNISALEYFSPPQYIYMNFLNVTSRSNKNNKMQYLPVCVPSCKISLYVQNCILKMHSFT